MPNPTPIDRLFDEAKAVIEALQKDSEVSYQIVSADHFRKALLLASASYFETRVCASVTEFFHVRSGKSNLIENFLQNKAIARQYHTWFSWDEANANKFFGLFGTEFKTLMINQVKFSDELRISIRAFLELGSERNKLVHQDYATFQMEKTLDEIYELYKTALKFVEFLPKAFIETDSHPEMLPWIRIKHRTKETKRKKRYL